MVMWVPAVQVTLAARGGPDGPRAARVAGGAAALRAARRGLRQRRHHRRAARAAGYRNLTLNKELSPHGIRPY